MEDREKPREERRHLSVSVCAARPLSCAPPPAVRAIIAPGRAHQRAGDWLQQAAMAHTAAACRGGSQRMVGDLELLGQAVEQVWRQHAQHSLGGGQGGAALEAVLHRDGLAHVVLLHRRGVLRDRPGRAAALPGTPAAGLPAAPPLEVKLPDGGGGPHGAAPHLPKAGGMQEAAHALSTQLQQAMLACPDQISDQVEAVLCQVRLQLVAHTCARRAGHASPPPHQPWPGVPGHAFSAVHRGQQAAHPAGCCVFVGGRRAPASARTGRGARKAAACCGRIKVWSSGLCRPLISLASSLLVAIAGRRPVPRLHLPATSPVLGVLIQNEGRCAPRSWPAAGCSRTRAAALSPGRGPHGAKGGP